MLSNDLSGGLFVECTGSVLITDAPIDGLCAYTGQSFTQDQYQILEHDVA